MRAVLAAILAITAVLGGLLICARTFRLPPVPLIPCPAPEITGNGTSILILPGCYAPGAP